MVAEYPDAVSRIYKNCAFVLVLPWLLCAANFAQGLVATAPSIRVKTVDGTLVAGTISKWDADGCDGDFGRIAWADLHAADVNRAIRKMIDTHNAAQLVLLGRALLCTEDGLNMGDSTLRQALKSDGSQQAAVEAARIAAPEIARIAAEHRLRAALPQASAESGVPTWPIATDAQRGTALEEMKMDTEKALHEVHVRWTPIESEFWVIYADLNRGDTQELGRRMDNMYRKVAEMFNLPKGLNLFYGKGVCIVSGDENIFRAIEQAAFQTMPPPGCIGLCHMIGAKVMVNAYRDPDEDRFMATLVHEATHGVMHRYGTPARLPIWAEEGYAEYVAAHSFESSPVDKGRRPQGLQFIREGNSTLPLLLSDGKDGVWPGDNAVGYAVGYLAVSLMIEQKGSAFGEWVKEVKAGVPWQDSLKKRFGTDAVKLAETIEGWYREHG